MKSKKMLSVCFVLLFSACSEEDNINLLKPTLISGKLTYKEIRNDQSKGVPRGTRVTVEFISDDNFVLRDYSFEITEDGLYSFKPFVEGAYRFSIMYNDSLLQFDKALVEKDDIDVNRASEFDVAEYTGTSEFKLDEDHKFFNQDIELTNRSTTLKLILKDEGGNVLKNMRVCIYDNESFAEKNSPNCGGSLAYLSSNEKGEVLFTGLESKEYFINARGNIGNVNINNQHDDSAKRTGVLAPNKINSVEVLLK